MLSRIGRQMIIHRLLRDNRSKLKIFDSSVSRPGLACQIARTIEELHQVIEWLTGFDEKKLQELIKEKVTFETFFTMARLNPSAYLITGLICGYRIEEIETPLTKQVRYLDKLVDELAKGKNMEKILRQA